MAWIYLFLSSFFEILGTIILKKNHGFHLAFGDSFDPKRFTTSAFVALCYIICTLFFGAAIKRLDASIVMAIWSALNIAGVATYAMIFLNEPHGLYRMLFLTLTVISIVGLILTGTKLPAK